MLDTIATQGTFSEAFLGADGKPLYPELSDVDRQIHEWQSNSPFYVAPPEGEKGKHIVDALIEERTPKLSKSRFWPLFRGGVYKVLGYRKGIDLVNVAGRMSATDAFAHASEKMGVRLESTGTEHIPKDGACILVINHPTGIADGLAAHDLVLRTRPDPIVFVNGDAIRLNPMLIEKLIPVEWHDDKKTRAKSRETLKASNKAFSEGRAVILFPSGRLAYMDKNKELRERPWMPSVAVLAKKYNVPVVPVHLRSRNSWLFYLLWKLNEELRDMTVFHEWFNKQGKSYSFTVQAPIRPQELLEDNDQAASELREYVEDGIEKGLTFQAWRESRPRQKPSKGFAVSVAGVMSK